MEKSLSQNPAGLAGQARMNFHSHDTGWDWSALFLFTGQIGTGLTFFWRLAPGLCFSFTRDLGRARFLFFFSGWARDKFHFLELYIGRIFQTWGRHKFWKFSQGIWPMVDLREVQWGDHAPPPSWANKRSANRHYRSMQERVWHKAQS